MDAQAVDGCQLSVASGQEIRKGDLVAVDANGEARKAGTETSPTTEPSWQAWVQLAAPEYESLDYPAELIDAIARAEAATGVSGSAIAAVLYKETGLAHYRVGSRGGALPDLRVVKGDNGRAIGAGQVHRCKGMDWQRYYSFNLGEPGCSNRQFNLDDLADNVEVCARILKRGGWKAGDVPAQYEAYAYYNSGVRGDKAPQASQRYAAEVRSLQLAIARSSADVPVGGSKAARDESPAETPALQETGKAQ